MRIVQISDLHIVGDPTKEVLGVNTHWALDSVLDSIQALEQLPEIVIATGDLADDGQPSSYRRLRESLLSLNIPVYVIPGNHDSPKHMLTDLVGGSIFSETVRIFESWGLIFLNSRVPGEGFGEIGETQMNRVSECLVSNPEISFLVSLHHTPITPCEYVGCKLQDGSELLSMLCGQPNSKIVIGGHAHVEAKRTLDGLKVYTTPPTSALAIHSAEAATDDFWSTHSFDAGRRGYRVLDLLPDGEHLTNVVWV